jgi:hypothetical protein
MKQDNNKQPTEDKDLPGYPHHSPQEDITQPSNNNGFISLDEEKNSPQDRSDMTDTATEGDVEIVMGTEADVTAEDLAILEQEDPNTIAAMLDDTDDDGEPLNEASDNQQAGDGLDVPGSEDDDANEALGEEDEENNYYSLKDNDTTEDTEGIP